MGVRDSDDWEEVDEAREHALAEVFGDGGERFHSPHPFALGGQAKVIGFYHHIPGATYVTAELTGKPDAVYADYELMICHRDKSDWGLNAVSQLAAYSQQAYIGNGESIDLTDGVPDGSQIVALVFHTYRTFRLYETDYDLRLCIGITKPELDYKIANGASPLIEALKTNGVYPYTDFDRHSVALP
jgi:suppressor of fused protein SUFU